LSRQRSSTSRNGEGTAASPGSSWRIRWNTAATESMPNAGRPVAANVIVTAQPKMSAAGVWRPPWRSSGAACEPGVQHLERHRRAVAGVRPVDDALAALAQAAGEEVPADARRVFGP
jgi:hypothetical protein